MTKIVKLIPQISQTHPVRAVKGCSVPFVAKTELIDLSKSLHKTFVKLSKNQINVGRRMDKEDAARYYFNIISNAMGIPHELRPQLIIKDIAQGTPRLSGCYDWGDNTLTYFKENRANKKLGKWWTFGLIRHELEHFRQYIDICRNKDTFKELCDYCVKLGNDRGIAQEQIKEVISDLNNNRRKILNYYTETNKNSYDYKKTKKYLDCTTKYETYDYKNITQCIKYFTQPMEFDACKVQGLNWLNYFKTLILG